MYFCTSVVMACRKILSESLSYSPAVSKVSEETTGDEAVATISQNSAVDNSQCAHCKIGSI